mmetsp:Transcript_2058/g.4442  ORF Transcript_2058/g.4442 Transcript_2058/m.4442 type:complete len:90 (+) Transcript_2058:159-428(+)
MVLPQRCKSDESRQDSYIITTAWPSSCTTQSRDELCKAKRYTGDGSTEKIASPASLVFRRNRSKPTTKPTTGTIRESNDGYSASGTTAN